MRDSDPMDNIIMYYVPMKAYMHEKHLPVNL